jgi:hypothetical protein
MGFAHWLQRRRSHRFIVMLPFWTIAYLIGNSIAHLLLGWEIRLRSALIYGTLMAVAYTFWPRGFLGWNGSNFQMAKNRQRDE